MSTILIADDEPLLRFHLQKALAEVWPEAEIIAQAANGDEAFALASELKPDVAFLDIHMPGLTGLEVALKIANQSTQVVFLTAFDQYAVEAFDQGAIDYLLKPLDEKRLMKTVQRLQQKTNKAEDDASHIDSLINIIHAQKPTHLTWLNAQQGEAIKVIHVDDVLCFKAEDKYTTLVTEEGEFLLRLSIKQLEEQLDGQKFWRIHRASLVNVHAIDRVEKTLTGHLQLFLKGFAKPIAVSRAKQHLFKAH